MISEILLTPFPSSEELLYEALRRARWPSGVSCIYCGGRVIKWGRYRGGQRYRCKECGRTFNDRTLTIFHFSRFSLREAIFILLHQAFLRSSYFSLSLFLGAPQGRLYGLMRRAKEKALRWQRRRGKMKSKVVEVDETQINCGKKGRRVVGRKPRRRGLRRRGRGSFETDRPQIMVLVGRGGEERYCLLRSLTKEEVLREVGKRVRRGTLLCTDEFPSYLSLPSLGFPHKYVCHRKGEYARGRVHVNGCESRFSLLKPFLLVHRGVSKENLEGYVAWFELGREMRGKGMEEAVEEVLRVVGEKIFAFSSSRV